MVIIFFNLNLKSTGGMKTIPTTRLLIDGEDEGRERVIIRYKQIAAIVAEDNEEPPLRDYL